MVPEAGTRGHQVSQDHVLLEAHEEVSLASNSGLGQHLGGLLEGGRRDEGVRGKRCLGHTQQKGDARGRLTPVTTHGFVSDPESVAVHDGTREEGRVTGIGDLHLAHHL